MKEDTTNDRNFQRKCLVLDTTSRDILDEVSAQLKSHGSRASYSSIVRYCLIKMHEKGVWDDLSYIY